MFRVPIIIEYEALKELELNAVTDALTGLYNRRLFGESFEKELNRARRYGQPLGLVLLDLHRFKEVNDTHGHPRGDEVLRAAARTLKKALRTSDSAFRIGGDEFALLLPQTDAPQAMALSRRVETVFAESLETLHVTVSVNMDHGVANFPQDGEHADQLIRVADERLYRLKHASHRRTSSASGASRAESANPSTTRTEIASSRAASGARDVPATPRTEEAPKAAEQKDAPSGNAPSDAAPPSTIAAAASASASSMSGGPVGARKPFLPWCARPNAFR
jgi:diguanylate cyclase (GGDEF)-like protein